MEKIEKRGRKIERWKKKEQESAEAISQLKKYSTASKDE